MDVHKYISKLLKILLAANACLFNTNSAVMESAENTKML